MVSAIHFCKKHLTFDTTVVIKLVFGHFSIAIKTNVILKIILRVSLNLMSNSNTDT